MHTRDSSITPAPGPHMRGVKATVLVVDDDAAVLAQFIGLFQRSGYEVRGFSDPRDLLAAHFDSAATAVIVSDMRMPRLSGLDLLQALRARGIALPVVFVSGESTHAEIVAAHEDPAASYVLKPALPGKLLAAVETALARHAERRLAAARLQRIEDMKDKLTPAQRSVFGCLLQSMSIQETAASLGMSAEAAKKHRQAVFSKLGCESVYALLQLVEGHEPADTDHSLLGKAVD